MLLKILLEDETAVEEIRKRLALEDFQDLHIREAMRVVYQLHAQGKTPPAAKLISCLRGEDAAQLISRISSSTCKFIDPRRSLSDCIRRINNDNLKNRLNKLQREIKLAQSWGHKDKIMELLGKYNQLVRNRSVK
jgi:replicative DNA helicase